MALVDAEPQQRAWSRRSLQGVGWALGMGGFPGCSWGETARWCSGEGEATGKACLVVSEERVVEFCRAMLTEKPGQRGRGTHHFSNCELVVTPGQGVRMTCDTVTYTGLSSKTAPALTVLVGSEFLMAAHNVKIPDKIKDQIQALRQEGQVVVLMAVEGMLSLVVALVDGVRSETAALIQYFKSKRVQCFMVTGDSCQTAYSVASAVGIPMDNILASATPESKKAFVEVLQRQGLLVAFVGDGTNDSLALAQANVGIAMGGGTDIAYAAGDMVLCNGRLDTVATALDLSKATMDRIMFNYIWAMVYNFCLVPVAAGVLVPIAAVALNPMLAGLAMAMSSVSVILSSLWLLRYKPPVIDIDSAISISSSKKLGLLRTFARLPGSDMLEEEEINSGNVTDPTAYASLSAAPPCACPHSANPDEGAVELLTRLSRAVVGRTSSPLPCGCGCGSDTCRCGPGCRCGVSSGADYSLV